MRLAACVLAAVLAAFHVAADVVTLKDGSQTEGTVVSVDAETVVLQTEVGRHEIRREAVRSIELGDVLVTGIVDRTFTSKAYRGRVTAPSGWTMTREPGLDFAARSGDWVAIGRSLPLEGMRDGGESMIGGAIAGLMSSMPGAEAAEPRGGTWAGQRMTRVDVTSPQVNLAMLFLHLPDHLVMLGVGAPPSAYSEEAVASRLAQWEQGFELVAD